MRQSPRKLRFLLTCAIADRIAAAQTRREAIKRAANIVDGAPLNETFKALSLA